MRILRFTVSNVILRDALHLPQNCTIVRVEPRAYSNDTCLDVAVPELPAGEIIETTPIVHREPETYTWDWSIHE